MYSGMCVIWVQVMSDRIHGQFIAGQLLAWTHNRSDS